MELADASPASRNVGQRVEVAVDTRYPHEAIVPLWYSARTSSELCAGKCVRRTVRHAYNRSCRCTHACPRLVWLDLAYAYLVMDDNIGSRQQCRFETGTCSNTAADQPLRHGHKRRLRVLLKTYESAKLSERRSTRPVRC